MKWIPLKESLPEANTIVLASFDNATVQKTFRSNCIDKKAKVNRGELPKYLVSNNHPPIIDRDTFNIV